MREKIHGEIRIVSTETMSDIKTEILYNKIYI